ncbi:hypothetical protein U1Q18_045798 [Sarracenia purpurea var. burkii]
MGCPDLEVCQGVLAWSADLVLASPDFKGYGFVRKFVSNLSRKFVSKLSRAMECCGVAAKECLWLLYGVGLLLVSYVFLVLFFPYS